MTKLEVIKIVTDYGRPYDQTLTVLLPEDYSSVAIRALFIQHKGKALAQHLISNECKRALTEELYPALATRALYCLHLALKNNGIKEDTDIEELASQCQVEVLDDCVKDMIKSLMEKYAEMCILPDPVPVEYMGEYEEYMQALNEV